MLEVSCSPGISLVPEPCLFALPDLRNHLPAGVLHNMEPVVDDVQMRIALRECAPGVRVHVAGYDLHMGHPLLSHEVAEATCSLLPL